MEVIFILITYSIIGITVYIDSIIPRQAITNQE